MAKNNGTNASRSPHQRRDATGRQRSRPTRSTSRTTSTGRRRTKSNPDAITPLASGYRRGRDMGMSAAQSIKTAGTRAVETVGEHPLPAILIGAGLAWLLLETSGPRLRQVRIVERSGDAIGELGSTIAEAAGTGGRAIRQAVGTAAEAIAQGASSVGEYVSDATSAVGEATASGYETIGDLWERHPLVMSAAILSAGIAAGLLLPGTARESSLMGAAASNVVKKVRSKSSQLVQAAAREGRRQGMTGDEIVHKVKRIARTASRAVTD